MGLLTGIDHAIIWVYILGMMAMGFWFARRHRTSDDYFVAGRKMSWIPIGLSIWSSVLSGISVIGAPGYSYRQDLQQLVVPLIFIIPIILVVIYMMLPIFHNLSLTTAYTYLERRFGLVLRTLGSGLFIIMRYTWVAQMIYASSLALHTMLGISQVGAVLLIGLLATLYTTLGGIMADIWSDVVQSFVITGTLLVVWFYVLRDVGGMGEIWRIGVATDHTYPLSNAGELWSWIKAPPDPKVEVMFLWLVLGNIVARLNSWGTDQITLQRYFSTRSIKHTTKAIWTAAIIILGLLPLLYFTGTGIFAYFHTHGDQFPNMPSEADKMLPYFVAAVLPAGISGLFIAGLLAATMSSVDSGVNCLSATIITDFYRRLRGVEGNERTRRAFDMLVAGGLGVIVAALGVGVTALYLAGRLGGVVQTMGLVDTPAAGNMTIPIIIGLIPGVVAGLLTYKLALPPVCRLFARLSPESADEAHYLRASRYISLSWGVLGTFTALFLGRLGQVYIQFWKLSGFWAGPLMGMFLLGLFTRRATSQGVIVGAITGFIGAVIWSVLGYTPFMYIVASTIPTLVVGYLVSLATPPPKPEQLEGLTFYTRLPLKEEE